MVALGDAVDDEFANDVITRPLFLEHEDSSRDLKLCIDSPVGSVTAALALVEVMRQLKSPVSTMCTGAAWRAG